MAGKDGLVIGAILVIGGALRGDIGRQGHHPGLGQCGVEIVIPSDRRPGSGRFPILLPRWPIRRRKIRITSPTCTLRKGFASARQPSGVGLQKRDLDLGHRLAALAGAEKPGRE
jgi:hypothetical protein